MNDDDSITVYSVKLPPFPNNELQFYTQDGILLSSKTVSAEQHKKLGYRVDIDFISEDETTKETKNRF